MAVLSLFSILFFYYVAVLEDLSKTRSMTADASASDNAKKTDQGVWK